MKEASSTNSPIWQYINLILQYIRDAAAGVKVKGYAMGARCLGFGRSVVRSIQDSVIGVVGWVLVSSMNLFFFSVGLVSWLLFGFMAAGAGVTSIVTAMMAGIFDSIGFKRVAQFMQSLASFFYAVFCAFAAESGEYRTFMSECFDFDTLSAGDDCVKKAVSSLVEGVSFVGFVFRDCLPLQKKVNFSLREAVEKNNSILVAYAALRGYSVNNVSELYLAMETAIDNGYTGLFKLLQCNVVNFGGQAKFKKDCTITLLHRAVEKKNVDIAKALLSACQGSIEVFPFAEAKSFINEQGGSPEGSPEVALYIAAKSGCAEMVELLLEHNADVQKRGGSSKPALWAAVGNGSADIVALLLEKDASTEFKDNHGNTVLHHLVSRMLSQKTDFPELSIDCINSLLKKNPNLANIVNGNGKTAFGLVEGKCEEYPMLHKRLEKAKKTGGGGASLNAAPDTSMAAEPGATDLGAEAVSPGAEGLDVPAPVSDASMTAEAGLADASIVDGSGPGAALAPVSSADLLNGANVAEGGASGERADGQSSALSDADAVAESALAQLFTAIEDECSGSVSELLKNQHLPINDMNTDGDTPLLCAIRRMKLGHGEIVSQLLSYNGIDIFIKDMQGRTPLALAYSKGFHKVGKRLQWMADQKSRGLST